jgi:hypothetical protein
VTESLRRNKRVCVFVKSRAFGRAGNVPVNSVMPDIVRSPIRTWRDLSTAGQPPDWTWDEKVEVDTGPFALCIAGAFPAPRTPESATAEEREAAVSKIVALGTAEVLANGQLDTDRDLALNLFNWLASRDQRLNVRPRAVDRRELDLRKGSNAGAMLAVSVFGLPGVCMLLGVFLAWRRRK